MIKFVENPNLPDNDVRVIICGSDDKDVLSFFKENEIDVIKSKRNKFIDPAVSFHSDMAAIHLGNEKIVIDKNQAELRSKLLSIGMSVTDTKHPIKGSYPCDVKLNFTLIGKTSVGCHRFADEHFACEIDNFEKLNVKQGYCKCSVLVVDNNALITDDVSVSRIMSEKGFECLLIQKGDVALPGHEYGFIGGASGKISNNKIIFFGNIRNHRDFSAIENFLKKHSCTFVCTDEKALRDIGGIIPIIEAL